jgi:hypothetical protein
LASGHKLLYGALICEVKMVHEPPPVLRHLVDSVAGAILDTFKHSSERLASGSQVLAHSLDTAHKRVARVSAKKENIRRTQVQPVQGSASIFARVSARLSFAHMGPKS